MAEEKIEKVDTRSEDDKSHESEVQKNLDKKITQLLHEILESNKKNPDNRISVMVVATTESENDPYNFTIGGNQRKIASILSSAAQSNPEIYAICGEVLSSFNPLSVLSSLFEKLGKDEDDKKEDDKKEQNLN